MPKTKIVYIGAGSHAFGSGVLSGVMQCSELRGSTLSLVDINTEKLALMHRLAERMNKESGAGLKIEHTTDRKEALSGAEFIIISFAVRRLEFWKLDFEIPLKHGIKQVKAECGGPGGLFLAFRNIPILLDICRDIEDLCPDAWVINFTNPVARNTMAINRYTRLKAVGLCHGIGDAIRHLSEILGVKYEDLDVKAAGINHFTWIMDLRLKSTGEDAYPILREKLQQPPEDPEWKLAYLLFKKFGYHPSPRDEEIGEYIPYAWEVTGPHMSAENLKRRAQHGQLLEEKILQMVKGEEPVTPLLTTPWHERVFPIILSILENRNQLELAVNIPNRGLVSNLPYDAIVEIPAVVSGDGIHGIHMGTLPKGIAAMLNDQIAVQELCVEAAVTGDREKAIQALLIDPVVPSYKAAEETLDELLKLEKPYLPRFQ